MIRFLSPWLILLFLIVVPLLMATPPDEFSPSSYFDHYGCAPYNLSSLTNSHYMFFDTFNDTDGLITSHVPDWSANKSQAWVIKEGSVNISNKTMLLWDPSIASGARYRPMWENASNYTINYFLQCDATPSSNTIGFVQTHENYVSDIWGAGISDSNGWRIDETTQQFGYRANEWFMVTAIADPINNNTCYIINETEILGCMADSTPTAIENFQIMYGRGMHCYIDNLVIYNGSNIEDCPLYSSILDTSSPALSNPLPENNTQSSTGNITFYVDTTDESAFNCTLFLNQTINETVIGTNGTTNFTMIIFGNNTDWFWYVNCTDEYNYSAQMDEFYLEIRMLNLTIEPGMLINRCPSTTSESINLFLIVIGSLIFILIGFLVRVGIVGFFGSILMMISSWYLAPCIAVFAYAIALLSFFLLAYFVLSGFGFFHKSL